VKRPRPQPIVEPITIVEPIVSQPKGGEPFMKNWKTTLSGVLSAAGQIGLFFGIPAEVGNGISAVGLFLMGLFGKDNGVTGTGM